MHISNNILDVRIPKSKIKKGLEFLLKAQSNAIYTLF